MPNPDSFPRTPANQSALPRGSSLPKRKPSLQHQRSSGWGWPRFVSVEVDVEEKRKQRKHEAMPVNATAELSRPEQGARNQSFQKAHDQISHHQPNAESRKHSADSNHPAAPASEDNRADNHAISAGEKQNNRTARIEEMSFDQNTDKDPGKDVPELAEASKIELPPSRTTSDAGDPSADTESKSDLRTAKQAHTHQQAKGSSIYEEGGDVNQDDGPQESALDYQPRETNIAPGAFPDDDRNSVYSKLSLDDESAGKSATDTKEAPSHGRGNREKLSQLSTHRSEAYSTPKESIDLEGRALSRGPPWDSHSSGTELSNERDPESVTNEIRQPESNRDRSQNLPAGQSRNSSESVPRKSPQESTAVDPGKTDADEAHRSSEKLWVPVGNYAAENIAGSPTDNAFQGEGETSAENPSRLKQTSSIEEATEKAKINHPSGSILAPAPAGIESRDGEEGVAPGQNTDDAVQDITSPSFANELAVSSEHPGNAQEAQNERSDLSNANGEDDTEGSIDNHPTELKRSETQAVDAMRRISVPASINARRSSKPNKKVTLPPPQIFVQSPSDATPVEGPTDPHPTPAEHLYSDEYRIISRNGSVVSPQHTVESAAERLGSPRVKKRKLYLRKMRNLAARRVFLNAALGRKMGGRTKERLQRLARGEEVPSHPVAVQPHAADAPPLRKRKSITRKVRNVASSQSLLNAALGRQVGRETKPVLRSMARGDTIVFEEA